MRHLSVYALGLAALASSAGAQDQQALVKLINDSFAVSGSGRAQEFLSVARMQGLVRNDEEAAVAKEVYASFMAGEAAGHARVVAQRESVGSGHQNPMGGTDLECNDTIAFAEILNVSTGSCTVTGATGGTDLRDVYCFTLPAPGEWLVSATMTGTTTTCNLFDDVGRLVVVGLLNAGVRGVSKICLPAGTYYINAVGTAYTLTVTAAPAVCPVLAAGPNPDTVNPAGLAADVFDVRSWKFTVGAAHADVTLSVASPPTAPTDHNLFFNLGRATAGRIHFCDNVLPLPPHANDPDMKAGLPAGTYYLYVQNSVATVVTPIPYTVTMTQTPIVPRPLCGATNYTFSNSGHRDLWMVTLSATDHITVDINNGTVPPTALDSYIELFDANMGLLTHNDDGCAAGTGCVPTFRSYLDVTLPAGTYYLTFRGFASAGTAGEFGDYAVTGTCGLPVAITPIGARRTEPTTIAAGGHLAYSYAACTDQPLQVAHNNNVFLVRPDGTLRGSYQQLVAPGSTVIVGIGMRINERLIMNQRTTSFSSTTAATIYPSGQLGIDLSPVSAVGAYQLKGEGKVGETIYLFLSVGPGPGFTPGAPFRGTLCLDLLTLTPMLFHPYAAPNCRVNFALAPYLFPDLRPFIPPASSPGLRFQAVTLPSLVLTNIAE